MGKGAKTGTRATVKNSVFLPRRHINKIALKKIIVWCNQGKCRLRVKIIASQTVGGIISCYYHVDGRLKISFLNFKFAL